MVIAQLYDLSTSEPLFRSALYLSKQLQKDLGILYIVQHDQSEEHIKTELQNKYPTTKVIVLNSTTNTLTEICDKLDASFLMIQLTDNKLIKSLLNGCRDLRIPYLFFKNTFSDLRLDKVLLPVGFLIEEIEKTQFASAFGRFFSSEIIMLLANDYGSKARTNANKMIGVFEKFKLNSRLSQATKDSFSVEFEAIEVAENENAGIIIISASREYGLDDLFFGPKELKVIKKSNTPVLIINPRADLYTLCD